MVSIEKILTYDKRIYKVYCLSTDTKPVDEIPNGSTLVEIDTGYKYMFDANSKAWIDHGSDLIYPDADNIEF